MTQTGAQEQADASLLSASAMRTPVRIWALVPAAGVGVRASLPGQVPVPKQYRQLAGRPMIAHSVHTLSQHPAIEKVVLALSAEDNYARQLSWPTKVQCYYTGGASRAHTVLQTLQAISAVDMPDWVLVHDAARPGLPLACVDALLRHCLSSGQPGLLAMPVSDSVKRSYSQQAGALLQAHVSREGLWLAQTPQCFPTMLLLQALQVAYAQDPTLAQITDEASAFEPHVPIHLVPGHWRNFKITWPGDFQRFELLQESP